MGFQMASPYGNNPLQIRVEMWYNGLQSVVDDTTIIFPPTLGVPSLGENRFGERVYHRLGNQFVLGWVTGLF